MHKIKKKLLKYNFFYRHQIQQAEKTKFTASHLDALPSHSYKPVAYHPEHVREIEEALLLSLITSLPLPFTL